MTTNNVKELDTLRKPFWEDYLKTEWYFEWNISDGWYKRPNDSELTAIDNISIHSPLTMQYLSKIFINIWNSDITKKILDNINNWNYWFWSLIFEVYNRDNFEWNNDVLLKNIYKWIQSYIDNCIEKLDETFSTEEQEYIKSILEELFLKEYSTESDWVVKSIWSKIISLVK